MAASKQQKMKSRAKYNFERQFELFDLFYLPLPKITYNVKNSNPT